MVSKTRRVLDHFFTIVKKGYDETNWIFVIIAGAGIITKLFGVGGAIASILAFVFFYVMGVFAIRREKRKKLEDAEGKRRKRKDSR